MTESLVANDRINFDMKPVLISTQESPLFVDKKTPPRVPAKMAVPLMANEIMVLFVKPLFTAFQVFPLFVDKNTPPPSVPN